jgi:hypothetical protein
MNGQEHAQQQLKVSINEVMQRTYDIRIKLSLADIMMELI